MGLNVNIYYIIENSEKLINFYLNNLFFVLNHRFFPEFILNLVQCGNDKICVLEVPLILKSKFIKSSC